MEHEQSDGIRLPAVAEEQHTAGASGVLAGTEELSDRKIDRIVQRTKHLTEDISEWVDLKLKLTQFEIEDRVNRELNQFVGKLMVGALALLALVMLFVAAALGLGTVTGHPAWGFLIVAICAILIAMAIRFVTPRFVRVNLGEESTEDKPQNE